VPRNSSFVAWRSVFEKSRHWMVGAKKGLEQARMCQTNLPSEGISMKYADASQAAYNGYAITTMPIGEFDEPEDPTYFERHPALEEIYVMHVSVRRAKGCLPSQVDLVGCFSDELPAHYRRPEWYEG
jgi:hypothetical protein